MPRGQRKDDETQTRAGEGDVISRQQNLTPERRRGERGKETKKQKQRGGRWGERSGAEQRRAQSASEAKARRRCGAENKTRVGAVNVKTRATTKL